jgi:glycosyltransferase involved in cell wall biosynthesis
MEKTILIFAYYSYRDPVFQSAVLPYFINFPSAEKFRFVLLTFEHDKYPLTQAEKIRISQELSDHKIIWKQLRWRSGTFKPVKKIIDLVSCLVAGIRLTRSFNVSAIYSEGWPGSLLGYYLARLTGCKHIVHTFEPHADYMVEAGVWRESSWETKLLRWHENKVALHASIIFTATDLYIQKLKERGVREKVLHRVPSCVDLTHFKFSLEARNAIRDRHGIGSGEPVLVYLGKFGGMYMEEEAFEFFKLCQTEINAWIMIVSPDDQGKISNLCSQYFLDTKRTLVTVLPRTEIPSYLSAADMGFVAVRQWPSKQYCSPIKTGEYLACGLPVIVPVGISDDGDKLKEAGLGILMKSLKKNAYLAVIKEWAQWIKTMDPKEIRNRGREYVKNDRSVQHYQNLYAQLFDEL